jgi:hypothetical protein
MLDSRTARVLLTTLVFTLALATAYVARAVIIIFAFAILFAYPINPVVRFLQRPTLGHDPGIGVSHNRSGLRNLSRICDLDQYEVTPPGNAIDRTTEQ